MAKAEWGVKRACPKCKERFYDLNKDPAECPNCGNVFEIASLYQSDIRSPSSSAKEKDKNKEFDPIDDDELIEDDEEVVVDDELLEDDDDDTVSLDDIADVPANDGEE